MRSQICARKSRLSQAALLVGLALVLSLQISPSCGDRVVVHDDDFPHKKLNFDKNETNLVETEPEARPIENDKNETKTDTIFVDQTDNTKKGVIGATAFSACGWLSNMLGVGGKLFVNATTYANWMTGMLPDQSIDPNMTYTTMVFGAVGNQTENNDLFRVEVGYVFEEIGAKVDLHFIPLFGRVHVEVISTSNIRVLPMHVHGAPFDQCHSVWNFLIEYSNATMRDSAWRQTADAVVGNDAANHNDDEGTLLHLPHTLPEAIDMVKSGLQKLQDNLSNLFHHSGAHQKAKSGKSVVGVESHHKYPNTPYRTSFVFVSAVEAESSIYVAAELYGCRFPDKPPAQIAVTGALEGYGCSATQCGWTVVGYDDGRIHLSRSSWVAYGGPMNMNFTTMWSQENGWNLTVVPMHSLQTENEKPGGPHFAHIFSSSAPNFDVFNAIITRMV